jgi:hypothetical protein
MVNTRDIFLTPRMMIRPDALGTPGQGIHFHVLGIAVVDLLATLLAAYLLATWRGWSVWGTFLVLVLVGTLVHAAVGVRTTLTLTLTKVFG